MDLRNFRFTNHDARIAYLEHLVNAEREQQQLVEEYRDYYNGDHAVLLTERQQEFLNHTGNRFRMNVCPVVVESLVERLEVSGFEPVEEETDQVDESEPVGLIEFAQALWEDNRLDAGQEELYRQAAIDHTTYLVLDVDTDGLITANHHDAYTAALAGGGGEGVKLHYATSKKRGRPEFATKRWAVTQGPDAGYRRYFVEYWSDEIRRYYQDDRESSSGIKEAAWKPDIPATGPLAGVWPIPWVDEDGDPLGIPVIEFQNGRTSELCEVTPLQRALNKSVIALIAAGDVAGFDILFASGWVPTSDGKQLTTDDRGKVTSNNKALPVEPGAIYYSERPDSGLNRVPGTDLDKLIRAVDRWTLAIAQVSRTPITNFQLFGQIPSSDSQQQLENGLLAKAQSRQRVYGNAWEDFIYLAARIADNAPVFNAGQIVGHGLEAYESFRLGEQTARLQTLWRDAQTRNEKEHLETLLIKRELGVPDEQIYLEAGYSSQQAAQFADDSEARRVATEADALEFSLNGGGDNG